MEIRDALKMLRSETGLTQTELAGALQVSFTTVSRWENGKTVPSRSLAESLKKIAESRDVSKHCRAALQESLKVQAKKKLLHANGGLVTVEHASLRQLIDNTAFPIYVSDVETDELLYVNREAEKMVGGEIDYYKSNKCYKTLMHSDAPCEFCHKELLNHDYFTGFDAIRRSDGNAYRVEGKIIKWNGHNAQVRYVTDTGSAVNIFAQKDNEKKFLAGIKAKASVMPDTIAVAHYNLTANTVSDAKSNRKELLKIMNSGNVDDVLREIRKFTLSSEDAHNFDIVKDRISLLNLYFAGQTRISIKHHLKDDRRYYESVFDIMQNPVSFDVEAVVILRDVTEDELSRNAAKKLLNVNYETIVIIDSESGNAYPFKKGHIEEVISEQKRLDSNIAGVAAMLRKYCVCDDVQRAVVETSLPYVKERLKNNERHCATYTLDRDGKKLFKRANFTYLDKTQTMILCAIEDLTEIYKQILAK